jgi:hypothetical protein
MSLARDFHRCRDLYFLDGEGEPVRAPKAALARRVTFGDRSHVVDLHVGVASNYALSKKMNGVMWHS